MRSYTYLTSAGSGAEHYVELPEDKFIELLRVLVAQISVDEAWYRARYRDVDEAIIAGRVGSARQHYLTAGYFENRMPRRIELDESWYLKEYPDVATAIGYGIFASATEHFERDGFREGRLPCAGWSLLGLAERLELPLAA